MLFGKLVADDQVVVERQGDALFARPDDRLSGLLEIRGNGIVKLPYLTRCKLALVVQLTLIDDIERLPDPETMMHDVLGVTLPLAFVDPNQPSAPARIRAHLTTININ